MKKISVADRKKIQSHLAEIWKVLYANGLEDIEFNRSPKSKQKKRMCEMLLTYNKDHTALTDGFSLCVSDHDSCWHCIEFAATKEEKMTWKLREDASDLRQKRDEKKEQRRRELEEEHLVAYWHKHFTTPYWSDGWSSCRFSKQNAEGDLKLVGPQPDDFVHWLYNGADAEWHFFSDEARVKYMKKYKLNRLYDLKTGENLKLKKKHDELVAEAASAESIRQDRSKKAKDYLRKKFLDDAWKDEAWDMAIEPKPSVYEYLDSVRKFIEAQEEYHMTGMMLYAQNETRAELHEKMLDDYQTGDYKTDELVRDVSKSFDFAGDYDPMTNKTKFYSEHDAALRLAYAIEVVKQGKYL